MTAQQLLKLFKPEEIVTAIDRAARTAKAVVAEFAAAPIVDGSIAVELAVEFFVPPASTDQFTTELDDELMKISFAYAAARHRAELSTPVVHNVGAGAFHQWRSANRRTQNLPTDYRWRQGRDSLDSIIHQSLTGWRETASV